MRKISNAGIVTLGLMVVGFDAVKKAWTEDFSDGFLTGMICAEIAIGLMVVMAF